MKSDCVFAECNIDTLVASMLCRVLPDHKQDCFDVAKVMSTFKLLKPCIGFVDGDKRMDKYFHQFYRANVFNVSEGSRIELKKLPSADSHFLFVAYPAMDKVVFDGLQRTKKPPKDFDQFKRLTKRVSVKDVDMRNKVNSILQSNSELRRLQELLNDMNIN